MNAIDRAHRDLARKSFRNYQDDISERDIKKTLFVIVLYFLCISFVTLWLLYDADAQSNDLPLNTDISTEDAVPGQILPMHEVGSVHSGAVDSTAPDMDIDSLSPPPSIDKNNLTPEQMEKLKAGQIKNMIKKGYIKDASELPFLDPARKSKNESEMDLYTTAIRLHDRAIREGKLPGFYVNLVNELPFSSNERRQILRDAEICGSGFEIYPDSQLCSKFDTHIESEQNYYHCGLNNYQLALRNGELEAICGYGAPTEKPCNDLGWSSVNIWKPKADNRGNEAVVILDRKYCNGSGQSLVSNFRVEDALGGQSASVYFRECDDGNGGRLHMGIKPQGSNIDGPIFVRYTFNGVEECRRVANPANRED